MSWNLNYAQSAHFLMSTFSWIKKRQWPLMAEILTWIQPKGCYCNQTNHFGNRNQWEEQSKLSELGGIPVMVILTMKRQK